MGTDRTLDLHPRQKPSQNWSQEPKPAPGVDPDPELDGEDETMVALESDLELVARAFRELSRDELYDLLKLRARVFVVEQDCPYLDPDGRD
ncbi:MAG: hypothetical protein ACLF0P_12520, partial [Thermoanaerobaculia bacterium]